MKVCNRFDDAFADALGLTKKELVILNISYTVLVEYMKEIGKPVSDPDYLAMPAQMTVATFLKQERGISA